MAKKGKIEKVLEMNRSRDESMKKSQVKRKTKKPVKSSTKDPIKKIQQVRVSQL